MTNDATPTTSAEPPPLARALHLTLLMLVGSAVACAALTVALVAVIHANHASNQALAGCQLYKTVAEAPLAPQTSALGLNLAVGARIAYETADCKQGVLKPPDPRVKALLPAGVK